MRTRFQRDAWADSSHVGTYREGQMEKWILPRGFYNYPVDDADTAIIGEAPRVGELRLYLGKAGRRRFSAKFVRTVSAAELDAMGYPQGPGPHHGGKYLLFKVKKISRGDAEARRPKILVRLEDFAHDDPKLQAKLKRLATARPPRKPSKAAFKTYRDILPDDLLEDGHGTLFACEAGVQLYLWDLPDLKCFKPKALFSPSDTPCFTFIDLFAGVGGIRMGFQNAGGECVFSSEWNEEAAKTYSVNFGRKKQRQPFSV